MGQPPLMRGIDGGSVDAVNENDAHVLRLVSGAMRCFAPGVADPEIRAGLAEQATEIALLADDLAEERHRGQLWAV